MHGAVVLDKDCKVLRPCIMWNDSRSAEEAEKYGVQQSINFKTTKDELFDKYYGVVVQKFGVTPTVLLNLLGTYSGEQIEQAIKKYIL